MSQSSFAATIAAWASQTKEDIGAIKNESAERIIAIMQNPVAKGGNMPVKSGFLRHSLKVVVGKANFTTQTNPNPELKFSYDEDAVHLVIKGAGAAEPIEAVYTAIYAKAANYGGENREPRMFVDLAAQQWPQVVAQVTAERRALSGS